MGGGATSEGGAADRRRGRIRTGDEDRSGVFASEASVGVVTALRRRKRVLERAARSGTTSKGRRARGEGDDADAARAAAEAEAELAAVSAAADLAEREVQAASEAEREAKRRRRAPAARKGAPDLRCKACHYAGASKRRCCTEEAPTFCLFEPGEWREDAAAARRSDDGLDA
jgi:hypothetical protein